MTPRARWRIAGVLVIATNVAVAVACNSGSSASDDNGDGGPAESGIAPNVEAASSSDAGTEAGAPRFTISATVVGLVGTGLVLREDVSGKDIPVSASGGGGAQTIVLSTTAVAGSSYDVVVKAFPSSPTQLCTVTGGKGTLVSGDVTSITVNCTDGHVLGGTVQGLAGTGLVIQNGGGDSGAPAGDEVTVNGTSFAFATPLPSGATYALRVKANPTSPWQTCNVTANANGTIASADVSNVVVACTTNTYALGIHVTRLEGWGAVFQNNGGADIPVSAVGTYLFASALPSGTPYAVTVQTQPLTPNETCVVTNASGKIGGEDAILDVACNPTPLDVGGVVRNLVGNGLVLQNNGGDDLPISATGPFTFATKVPSGQQHHVTVKTQPSGSYCGVLESPATVGDGNVTSVVVECANSCKDMLVAAGFPAVSPPPPPDAGPDGGDAGDGGDGGDGGDAGPPLVRPASGVRTFFIPGRATPITTFCDMNTDGGGWTFFLNRAVGSDYSGQLSLDQSRGTFSDARAADWQLDARYFYDDATEFAFSTTFPGGCAGCELTGYLTAYKVPKTPGSSFTTTGGANEATTATAIGGPHAGMTTTVWWSPSTLGYGSCQFSQPCFYGFSTVNVPNDNTFVNGHFVSPFDGGPVMLFPGTGSRFAWETNFCRSCASDLYGQIGSSVCCDGQQRQADTSIWAIWAR